MESECKKGFILNENCYIENGCNECINQEVEEITKGFTIGERLGYENMWNCYSTEEAVSLGVRLGIESSRVRDLCALGCSVSAHLSGDIEFLTEIEKFHKLESFKLFSKAYQERIGSISLLEILFIVHYIGMCNGEYSTYNRIKREGI